MIDEISAEHSAAGAHGCTSTAIRAWTARRRGPPARGLGGGPASRMQLHFTVDDAATTLEKLVACVTAAREGVKHFVSNEGAFRLSVGGRVRCDFPARTSIRCILRRRRSIECASRARQATRRPRASPSSPEHDSTIAHQSRYSGSASNRSLPPGNGRDLHARAERNAERETGEHDAAAGVRNHALQ